MPIRPENRDRYPADWPAIREAILQRAKHGGEWSWDAGALPRCECFGECGRGTHDGRRCPNVQGRIAYGTEWAARPTVVVLTIAHLDHTPENCDPGNLRAMCQGCHLHYDRDHHAQTRRETAERERREAGQDPLWT